MAFHFDPRRDLPPPNIEPSSYYTSRRTASYGIPLKKAKAKQCYDWIFSSASNVHVAIDRAAFKTYFPFRSYVLTVADQRQVFVRGIGTVEVKIRREPGGKDSHTVCLENVLHIPDWICNIVSDICFVPAAKHEHSWTEFGVNFFVREKESLRPWGYTENFCGLDRLVLSRNLHGRSPMLEDADREVFCVSLTWPESQRDKWDELIAQGVRQEAERLEKGFRRKKVEDETKGLKRDVKSTLVEQSKWKPMPDVTATMKKQWKSGLNESDGGPQLMARGSSLMFESHRA
ncbi:hypothetical protein A1O1_02066 [Capronia coronata CBS 617.96]|uniref:Retrovirus-related Pol polyprotein from transposon TNT 1-94-like beta-barrel domain-containing protein n=1 Tax=Capronia coronata CBS 617.96 TaxID=1182541 RepID=W9ZGN8_9EURO|nr:uncharacterized protein A1O1_02066 [Capronia coronata CBS 617.96]EXJ93674.1 hypothetical protein A1O1_02066 [Capronia coronata CBS 617.96]